MIRRNKVMFVRGCTKPSISHKLTIAPIQRANIDHIVIAMFLRDPQHMSPEIPDPDQVFTDTITKLELLVQNLEHLDKRYIVISEYASVFADRGQDLRVVEGHLLERPWIYNTLRTIHKSSGQQVTEIDLTTSLNNMIIDGQVYSLEVGLAMLTYPSDI